MEEKRTNMKDIKIITFDSDNYKDFIKKVWNDKVGYLILASLSLISYIILLFSKGNNNFIYVISLFSFGLFFGMLAVIFFSSYFNTINKINADMWGVSIVPIVSYFLCYRFFIEVSFDKTFVIGASIILSWIFTKYILSICKDMKKQ